MIVWKGDVKEPRGRSHFSPFITDKSSYRSATWCTTCRNVWHWTEYCFNLSFTSTFHVKYLTSLFSLLWFFFSIFTSQPSLPSTLSSLFCILHLLACVFSWKSSFNLISQPFFMYFPFYFSIVSHNPAQSDRCHITLCLCEPLCGPWTLSNKSSRYTCLVFVRFYHSYM